MHNFFDPAILLLGICLIYTITPTKNRLKTIHCSIVYKEQKIGRDLLVVNRGQIKSITVYPNNRTSRRHKKCKHYVLI